MRLQVLFFGATAAVTGKHRIEVELPHETKVAAVFEKLVDDHPGLANHRLHFSVNLQYATGNETLYDGDELAIFTAVSGG